LLNGNDNRLKLAVLYLLEQLKDKQFLPLVQEHKNSDNAKVRQFAANAETSILNA
jgi:AAA family ATP:ADP antiporter